MKRKIHNVLRSRAGASITFALLLFLVCAVVGALVLTASTTASGRMSELAKMDQRYYGVTSAANLISGELCDKPVEIERTRTITTVKTTTYRITVTGSQTTVAPDIPTISSEASYNTRINDVDVTTTPKVVSNYDPSNPDTVGTPLGIDTMSFLTARAARLLFDKTCNTDAAMNASMKNGTAHEGTFRISHDVMGLSADKLATDCKYEILKDGTLRLTFWNADGADKYSLLVTMEPTIEERQSEDSTSKVDRVYGESTEYDYADVVTTEVVLTKYASIKWSVKSVEKVYYEASTEEGG